MRRRWLIAPVPILLGLLVAGLAGTGRLPDPVLFLRADIVVVALLAGIIVTALLTGVLASWEWVERVRRQVTAQSQEQAADDRRRFLRRLDHELKNPLMAMRAGLANLDEISLPEMPRETLGSVEAQVLRLSRLAADLRKLAELETLPIERGPVEMAGLLEEVLSLTRECPGAEDRALTLVLPRAPWPLPAVPGDRDLLFLALHNLVDNAVKFTRPGDTVEMRAFEDGANVVVEVADTGPGIPEEEVPHVWEELYRGQGARGVAGSGLGLALARAIVARHGGQVALRSRVAQGTVVTVRLPTRAAEA